MFAFSIIVTDGNAKVLPACDVVGIVAPVNVYWVAAPALSSCFKFGSQIKLSILPLIAPALKFAINVNPRVPTSTLVEISSVRLTDGNTNVG